MFTSLVVLSSHNLCHQYHPELLPPDVSFQPNTDDSWALEMDDKTASIALKHCIPGSSIWKIINKNICHIHTDISWLSWFSKQPLRHDDLLNSVVCVCKCCQYLALLLASIHKFRCTVHASLNLINFCLIITKQSAF